MKLLLIALLFISSLHAVSSTVSGMFSSSNNSDRFDDPKPTFERQNGNFGNMGPDSRYERDKSVTYNSEAEFEEAMRKEKAAKK